jgi:hypothetical protein
MNLSLRVKQLLDGTIASRAIPRNLEREISQARDIIDGFPFYENKRDAMIVTFVFATFSDDWKSPFISAVRTK